MSEDGRHFDLLMPSPNDPTSVVHLFGVPKVRDSLEMEIPCSTLWGSANRSSTFRSVATSQSKRAMYCRSVAAPRKGAATWQQGGGERGAAINGSPASGGYGPYGIRVNCIAPETILTDRNLERIPKDQLASLVDAHPLKRLGTPEDVTQAAVFLASRKAGWITGVVLDVAGGAVMLR